jgi:hypothetical protein
MKLNKIILVALVGIFALGSSCGDGGGGTTPGFSYEDEAERYAKDLDSIEHYLHIHYVNDLGDLDPATYRFDSIPDGGSQISLWDDSRLQYIMETNDADQNDVRQDYKIYYMKFREGVGQRPTYVDSVYTSYKGIVATGTQGDTEFTNVPTPSWLTLTGLVRAWHHTLPQIQAGTHTSNPDGTVDYNDFGILAFFAPSGVAYFERNTSAIPSYTPLIFQVELKAVKTDVDHDHDGILTIHEDLNGNEDVRDDNTDGDQEPSTNQFPNFNDDDDDNDGHKTQDEGSDPNGDGNPSDAEDLDNDGIPNYLDSDSH